MEKFWSKLWVMCHHFKHLLSIFHLYLTGISRRFEVKILNINLRILWIYSNVIACEKYKGYSQTKLRSIRYSIDFEVYSS